MKKIIFSLIILFFLCDNAFAITGVWLLDGKTSNNDLKICSDILEIKSKVLKGFKEKYSNVGMKFYSFFAYVGVGEYIHIKKNGEVEFYGHNPNEKKKYPTLLNSGKWGKKGKEIKITPEDVTKDFKFGTFIAKVKEEKATMNLLDNKAFKDQFKLLLDISEFNNCLKSTNIKYNQSDKLIGDFLQPSLKTLEQVNNGIITTCWGKQPLVNNKKVRFAYPDDGGNPYGTCVEDLLQVTRQLKLKLKFIKEKDLKSCFNKMKIGGIDIMPCLGKKGDREKYMNLNKYYGGNISISKKSVFSKHNVMFEISAQNIKEKQSWQDWGKSHKWDE